MFSKKVEVNDVVYFVHSFAQTEVSILQPIIVEGIVIELERNFGMRESGNVIVQCLTLPDAPKKKISRYKVFFSKQDANSYARKMIFDMLSILNNEDSLYKGVS